VASSTIVISSDAMIITTPSSSLSTADIKKTTLSLWQDVPTHSSALDKNNLEHSTQMAGLIIPIKLMNRTKDITLRTKTKPYLITSKNIFTPTVQSRNHGRMSVSKMRKRKVTHGLRRVSVITASKHFMKTPNDFKYPTFSKAVTKPPLHIDNEISVTTQSSPNFPQTTTNAYTTNIITVISSDYTLTFVTPSYRTPAITDEPMLTERMSIFKAVQDDSKTSLEYKPTTVEEVLKGYKVTTVDEGQMPTTSGYKEKVVISFLGSYDGKTNILPVTEGAGSTFITRSLISAIVPTTPLPSEAFSFPMISPESTKETTQVDALTTVEESETDRLIVTDTAMITSEIPLKTPTVPGLFPITSSEVEIETISGITDIGSLKITSGEETTSMEVSDITGSMTGTDEDVASTEAKWTMISSNAISDSLKITVCIQ